MKHIYTILSLILISNILYSRLQIPLESVSAYISQHAKVCDKETGTYVTKLVSPKAVSDKPLTYLNLGADFPNSKLTIVIFQKDLHNFPITPSDHYKGQNVCDSGTIKKYNEKMEIIANGPDQIEMK